VSSQTPDHAQVIPLRPATAAVPPVPPASADRVTAGHEGRAVPGVRRDCALVPGRLPGPVRPAPVPSRVPGGEPAREPLWRHVVGDVLRRERRDQGLRLKDVADAARISMPYLSEIERGRKEASSEVLAAAARALGLSLADLLALAQAGLARFAPARRAGAGDPVRPAQQPGAAQAVPGADGPAGDDGMAAPPRPDGRRPAGVWLAPPLEPTSPQQPGQAGPPQVRMSLAA
jgi:transcriptional regulator with XRE-family HTH domain